MENILQLVDYPGYQVSDMGSVYSKRTNGGLKVLKGGFDRKGYLLVVLTNTAGKRVTQRIHRLIALAFIPNPENKPEVNHKDGIKTNNKKSNLEWNTGQENKDHAWRTGLRNSCTGEKHGMAKLTDLQVKEIRKRYAEGRITQQELADTYGVSSVRISLIVNFKSRVTISEEKEPMRNKGISWHKEKKMWRAEINLKNNKRIYLGLFLSQHAAAEAYNQRALEIYGSEAKLNRLSG